MSDGKTLIFLMAATSGLQRNSRNFSHILSTCALVVFVLIIAFSGTLKMHVYGAVPKAPKQAQNLNGDFIIGGLFPVFLSEKDATKCQANNKRFQQFTSLRGHLEQCYRMNLFGLMWVEAMLFAIAEVNNSTEILPNVTLGYDIRDSANEVQFAIDAALDFTSGIELYNKDSRTKKTCSNSSIVAVIGGAGSKISKAAGYILGVSSIPQISYSSTSPSLSNKANFPSFLRTIPPDYVQAQVMADLVTFYNWTYVSTVATDEDYGRLGIEAFKREIKNRNVCVAVDELFHPDYTLPETKEQISRIVSALKTDKLAKVVVLFCEIPNALAFLEEAERQNLQGKIWIGTDSWGDKKSILSFRDSTVSGMLAVVPSKGNIRRFEQHLARLTPLNTNGNPWFEGFWQGTYGCRKENHSNHCVDELQANHSEKNSQNCSHQHVTCPGFPGDKLPNAASLQLSKAANVMDAVNAVALALDEMIKCKKGRGLLSNETCPVTKNGVKPLELLTYIKNLSFTGKLGFPVVFDRYGDIKGDYLVKSLQPDPGHALGKKYITLGTWDWATRKLHFFNNTDILWNGWSPEVPFSRCSLPCEPGFYKVQGDLPCCWKCVQCPSGAITSAIGLSECQVCGLGFTSTKNHTSCLPLPEVYLEWGSKAGSVILGFSGVGFVCSAFVLGAFYRYRNSAVVKASTREYSFLILLMISSVFLLPLLHLGRATDIVCKAQPFCFGFVTTFLASLMLTKTLRLLLIFKKKVLPGKVGFYSIRMQLLISFLLTLGVVAAIILWVLSFPPEVTLHFYETRVSIDCGEKADKLLMIILGYAAVLAIPSTYLAYRARKLPEKFNETRLIGFTMFTVCVIWIIFVPCYNDSDVQNRSIFVSVALITTGFTILVCMFSARLRIILFQPEKNKTELVRASMFDYTIRMCNGSTTAQYLRKTSVVTLGTFSVPPKER